jgi:methyl-accepting chemotaxis protein
MGLRLRLILVLIIPLVLVVGVYGLVRIRQEQAQLLDEDQRNMALTAKALQIAVENALRDRQISDIKRLLSEIVEYQTQIDRIRLFDRKLSPTLVSNPLSIGEEVPVEAVRRVIETGQPEGFYQRRGKQPVLYYLVPLRGGRGEIQGVMEVVHLAAAVDQKVQAATRDVWVRLAILLVAVGILTGLVLQRQVLHPLSRLMHGIRSLGQGQLGSPLPVERRDELGRVAEAFNQMAEQLEAARQKLLAETERTLDLEQQLRQAETLAVAGKLATRSARRSTSSQVEPSCSSRCFPRTMRGARTSKSSPSRSTGSRRLSAPSWIRCGPRSRKSSRPPSPPSSITSFPCSSTPPGAAA